MLLNLNKHVLCYLFVAFDNNTYIYLSFQAVSAYYYQNVDTGSRSFYLLRIFNDSHVITFAQKKGTMSS